MTRRRIGSILLLVSLLRPLDAGAGLSAQLQETGVTSEEPGGGQSRPDGDAAKRLVEYKRAAGRYTIRRDSEPPVILTLKEEPVLRWNSPLRVAYDGVLFVWTVDGRPEAAATFYRKIRSGAPYEQHEFQSFAMAPLSASYAGKVVWSSRVPGVALAPIPGAPKPAATPAARLRQMRALAEEFRAEMTDAKGASPLRLLTQPLYRYEADRAELPDGSLFAFVHATDPVVLLLIEARPVSGATTWHFGFGRMSGYPLRAWHKERLVWDVRSMDSSYKDIEAPEQPR
jgi:hypothetical protein